MYPSPELEQAVVDAALNLAGQTMSHAFTIPIPNTTPRLMISLYEEGRGPVPAPEIQPHPCSGGGCALKLRGLAPCTVACVTTEGGTPQNADDSRHE